MKRIYLIFSATPYKMGKFIRCMTGNCYNHVSVALDGELETLYTFARIYRDTPFCGGFITESWNRYQYHGMPSRVRICCIPVPDDRYALACAWLDSFCRKPDKYLYNTISAVFSLFKKRIVLKDSYTCVEFVSDFLALIGKKVAYGKFHTVDELSRLFSAYVIYEGSSADFIPSSRKIWGADHFPERHGLPYRTYATVGRLARLAGRSAAAAAESVFRLWDRM